MEKETKQIAIEPHDTEQSIALELLEHAAQRSGDIVLHPAAVQTIVARYQGDVIGAAMATDMTAVMAAELPLDGELTDIEIDPVDDLVDLLRSHGLAGIPVDQIAGQLNVDFSLGALNGILTLNAMLSDGSLGHMDELRKSFATSIVDAEEDKAERLLVELTEDLDEDESLDDTHLFDWDENGDENDETLGDNRQTITAADGQEFEID